MTRPDVAQRQLELPAVRIEVEPRSIDVRPGAVVRVSARGGDKFDQTVPLRGVRWFAMGGAIDADGVLCADEEEGTFAVTAEVGELAARASVNVSRQAPTIEWLTPPPPPPAAFRRIPWCRRP